MALGRASPDPLKPRVPWHGVSLGEWPEEAARLVELAEQGREDEAAALLLRHSRALGGEP